MAQQGRARKGLSIPPAAAPACSTDAGEKARMECLRARHHGQDDADQGAGGKRPGGHPTCPTKMMMMLTYTTAAVSKRGVGSLRFTGKKRENTV